MLSMSLSARVLTGRSLTPQVVVKLRLVAPVASAAIMPLVWSSALSVKLSCRVFLRPGTQLAAQRHTDAGARDRAGVRRRAGRSGTDASRERDAHHRGDAQASR
jgi:hypothetical protein